MDNDDLRRGKPTLHKVYNEGHAVLTGDYLLTYAFEVLGNAKHLTSDQKIKCINLLAKRAGGDGVIGGQVIDIHSTNKQLQWDLLEEMHLKKTASLISLSLEVGGIIAGASETDLELLKTCGNHLGLAFQIVDDLLDNTASIEELGKPIGSDIINGKTTVTSLLSPMQAKNHAQALLERAKITLSSLTHSSTALELLITETVARKS